MMKNDLGRWIALAAVACAAAWAGGPCGAAAPASAQGPLFPDAATNVAPREIGWMSPGDVYPPPSATPIGSPPPGETPSHPRVIPSFATTPEGEPSHESTWYARADYFDWQERLDGVEFVREQGCLPTVGYQHRFDRERVRAEVFGGTVDYGGLVDFDVVQEWVPSVTRYFGARGEYDLLLEPDGWPIRFLLGVGARAWSRELPDATSPVGNLVIGYTERWISLYPYAGLERRLHYDGGAEWYGSMRGGLTAVNYESINDFDLVLHPKAGAFVDAELGLRGRHFQAGGFFQFMSWNESNVVRGSFQPYSRMLLAGVKGGWSF